MKFGPGLTSPTKNTAAIVVSVRVRPRIHDDRAMRLVNVMMDAA